jgi:hypothetical protein
MSRRRITIAGAATVAAGVVVVAVVALGGDNGGPPPAAASTGATASVERRSLVDRDTVDGTLGYADASTLVAGVSGVLTGMRDPGSVVTRGHSLYEVDGAPAAFLLYGELPAWRDLASGISDGEDVRQLERNLRALGPRPRSRHGDRRPLGLGDDRGGQALPARPRARRDRTLSRGRVVFRPGATRIGEAEGAGRPAARPGRCRGRRLLDRPRRSRSTSTRAGSRSLARGDTVTVDLPTGASARGRITDVGKVATKPSGPRQRGRRPDDRGHHRPRGPPPDVARVSTRRRSTSASPSIAASACSPCRSRRYSPARAAAMRSRTVEGGGHRIVPVEPGLYAEDWVEVVGRRACREGMKVVTAQ